MREEEQVREPRRREVAEVLAGEADVRALERLEIVRQRERPAVGDALPASRDRGVTTGVPSSESPVRSSSASGKSRGDNAAEHGPEDDDADGTRRR